MHQLAERKECLPVRPELLYGGQENVNGVDHGRPGRKVLLAKGQGAAREVEELTVADLAEASQRMARASPVMRDSCPKALTKGRTKAPRK